MIIPDWLPPRVEMTVCSICVRTFADVYGFTAHLQTSTLCVAMKARPTYVKSASVAPLVGIELSEYAAYADASGGANTGLYDISGFVTDMSAYPSPVNCPSCYKAFAAERSLRRSRHL